MKTISTDVLIVGAGPAGLTASALLARAGVLALTVSKYPGTADSPRAHITNQRTVEVLRDLGIEDRVMERALPQRLMGKQVVATSFAGREICRMMTWGAGVNQRAEYEKASPCEMCNAAQHIIEPILLDRARSLGAEIRFNHEVVGVTQDEEGATAQIRLRTSGEEYQVRAKYIVGCDGAQTVVGSPENGFEFDGPPPFGTAVTVWIEADLTKYTKHRSGALFMVAAPGSEDVLSIWTCVEPWTEWSTIFFRAGLEAPDLSEEAVIGRVREAIGDPKVDFRIKKVSPWQINRTFAKGYRQGRLFIAGDAAHRHLPAGGLGSCTSIQDSYNLAWKLAMVLNGRADDSLLDSYSDERQPVGKQIVERAALSAMEMRLLFDALQFRPGLTPEEGNALIDRLHGPEGEAQRLKVLKALDLMNYQFNAHGVEMGFRYPEGALVDDGTPFPKDERDPQLHVQPTTHPGARLPHAWLQRGTREISTLDLCDYGTFTLLVGADSEAWREAALEATRSTGVPVRPVVVDLGQTNNDVLGDWIKLREVSASGCILARPDRVVAWRSSGAVEDPGATLTNVMQRIAGRVEAAAPAGVA